jgi:hypothetical protein
VVNIKDEISHATGGSFYNMFINRATMCSKINSWKRVICAAE